MSRARPLALVQVGVLLLDAPGDRAVFREGAAVALDEILARLAELEPAAGLESMSALLGLELVLRDRDSAEAADQLNAAFRRSPAAVRILIEIEQRRLRTVAEAERSLASERVQQAPHVDAPMPAGALKAGSLGVPHDLDRRRAQPRR